MHKNVPAEKARAPGRPGRGPRLRRSSQPQCKHGDPAGIISPNPRFTSIADQRDEPALSMSEVIVKRIGRLVDQRGQEDAQSRAARARAHLVVGGDAARECDATDE